MINALTIQKALKEAGHYKGELDGAFGKISREARGKALAAAGVDTSGWPHSRLMVAIRQWVLLRDGYKPGAIDGIMGTKTDAALRAWAKENGGKAEPVVLGAGKGISKIVIHCTATREGQPFDAAAIDRMHRNRGWSGIGYHFVIGVDGLVERGREEHKVGAHVGGHNTGSIGVVYVGGLDAQGKAKDTRTDEQKEAMAALIKELVAAYPKAKVMGHRDLSPDKDGDGIVEPHEWLKMCPCFDVAEWWKETQKGQRNDGH